MEIGKNQTKTKRSVLFVIGTKMKTNNSLHLSKAVGFLAALYPKSQGYNHCHVGQQTFLDTVLLREKSKENVKIFDRVKLNR